MGSILQAWRLNGADTADRSENCQAGVFLGYASRKGATLLDRRLYLPESWFAEDHQALWQDCQIPDDIPFQTKHELAAQLVEGVMQAGRLRARWVVCDEGFGDSPAFLERLAGAGLWYLAEVPRDTKVWPLVETDGQTHRPRPSSWVPPQKGSRKGPAPRRERLHPASPDIRDAGGAGQRVASISLAAVPEALGTQRPAGRRFSYPTCCVAS